MTLDQAISFGPITKEQIKDYCEASGDHNRIHWDEAFAKEAGLPDIIAHGMLSMGLLGEALSRWGIPVERLQNFESKFKEILKPGDMVKALCLNPNDLEKTKILRLSLQNQSGQEVCNATVKILP